MENTHLTEMDWNSFLCHKGYYGSVEIDSEDRILHGKVLGISDYIVYEGSTIEELEKDFVAGVESYLETCKQNGKIPEKCPFENLPLD